MLVNGYKHYTYVLINNKYIKCELFLSRKINVILYNKVKYAVQGLQKDFILQVFSYRNAKNTIIFKLYNINKYFTGSITSWASLMFGEMYTLRNTNYLNMISSLLYHSFTTLGGLQTLGEEYVNIIQVR